MISQDKNFLRIDIWNNRKAADFMHYIKNEFLNAQMQGTYVMVDIFIILIVYFGVPGTNGKHIRGFEYDFANYLTAALTCFCIAHWL